MDLTRTHVLAVDPGLANGVGLVKVDGLVKVHSAELTWLELASYVSGVFRDLSGVDVVVEDFRISPATAKHAKGAKYAIEVIGQMKLLMAQYRVPGDPAFEDNLPLQTAGDAEKFADGDRLRALGWWHRGGKGHANMALRHVGLRLLRTGVKDRKLLGLE